MKMLTIGRVPIEKPGPLQDPFTLDTDKNALIVPAEDFTISIKTISLQLYTKYKEHYKAGEFDNDYFALVSEMGLGDIETPTLEAHYLTQNSCEKFFVTSSDGYLNIRSSPQVKTGNILATLVNGNSVKLYNLIPNT